MQHTATANWTGSLREGTGALDVPSGAFTALPYSYKGRFVDDTGRSGTSPEELIAAAHSGCFAMRLGDILAQNGTPATNLEVETAVTLVPGTGITCSALTLVGTVPGIDNAKFQELAEKAKVNCPVSRALGAITITLEARLR